MDKEKKISYIPSQTKRFEISHDSISRERLAALAATVRELRRKHPFVVGAVLFGSLSKGKKLNEQTAAKSDIDFIIYLDPDELKENYDVFERDRDNARFSECEKTDKEFHKYCDPRSEDEKTLELTAGYIKDMAEDMFKANLPTENQRPRYIGFEIKPISLTGYYSIYNTLKRVFRYHNLGHFVDAKSSDLNPLFYSSVALPWALDIGGGLAKHRKAYLTQLQILNPRERELEWRAIIRIIKFYERQGDIPERIKGQYPETFEEAVKYYGVSKSSPTQVSTADTPRV